MEVLKVAMTPCLFELMSDAETEQTEIEHLSHLNFILDYLLHLNVEIDLYENAPYYPDGVARPPISRYHYYNASCSQIYAKIQKKISYTEYILLEGYQPSQIVSKYDYPENSETRASFLKYITYLVSNSKDALLFVGKANSSKPRPFSFLIPENENKDIFPIYDPSTDRSGQLGCALPSSGYGVPFPNSQFCTQLNNLFLQQRSRGDKMSLIKEFGTEAATRNGYLHDVHLSSLNTQKQGSSRVVFSRPGNSPTYLSLDFESGGFEVFDSSGCHIGQYSFDGMKVKAAAPQTHKIYFA